MMQIFQSRLSKFDSSQVTLFEPELCIPPNHLKHVVRTVSLASDREIPPAHSLISNPTFLGQLPAEIRLQIYRKLVGDLSLSFLAKSGQIALRTPARDIFSLLLTCRQRYVAEDSGFLLRCLFFRNNSYREFSSFIYSFLPVSVQHPSTLMLISSTIASSSLNSITCLSMIWPLIGLPPAHHVNVSRYQPHSNEFGAMRAWNIVAGIERLKFVNVEFNVAPLWREGWRGSELALLDRFAEAGGLNSNGDCPEQYDVWVQSSAESHTLAASMEDGIADDVKLLQEANIQSALQENNERIGWSQRLRCEVFWK